MMRRLAIAVVLLLACAAGVASASVLISHDGDDTAGGPDTFQPAPGSARNGADQADPRGGPPYGVRTYTSKAGLACPEPGRFNGGRFGRVGSDGRFQVLPVQASGDCVDLDRVPIGVSLRVLPSSGAALTGVLYGVVSPAVRALVLTKDGADRPVPIRDATFILVAPAERFNDAVLTASQTNGRQLQIPLGHRASPSTSGP